jgi:hypothetical protein
MTNVHKGVGALLAGLAAALLIGALATANAHKKPHICANTGQPEYVDQLKDPNYRCE